MILKIVIDIYRQECYIINMLSLLSANRGEEVRPVATIFSLFSFLVSVVAGIISNFLYSIICKWLDGKKK